MLAPPRPPSPRDDLELLIREARSRRRRRRLLFAGVVAVVAAAGLSVWAALPGRGGGERGGSGGRAPAAGRGLESSGRVPISQVGTSGGVTWVLNGRGMWLTTNGGRSWRASQPSHVAAMGDAVARVPQVQFFDRRHGWVFAVDVKGGLQPVSRRHAELDWTSDGGRSWHSTIPEGCCGNVSFVTPSRGFSLGPSQLISTIDGGATWKRVSRPPFGFGAPSFVDARHGVAVAAKGDFFRTTDGGRRWTRIRLPGRPRDANDQMVLPAVASFDRRLVVPAERYLPDRGSGGFRLVVYVSDDGGSTWTVRPAPRGWVPAVGPEDPQKFSAASPTAWFAAARREIAATADAGRTWRLVRPVGMPARWIIGAIDFTSADVGWAIFNGPRQSVLMRTTDGGVHWKPAGPRAPRRRTRS